MVAAEVFGQHEEKKEIVSWLTQPDQIKEDAKIVFANHLSIFSIVGVGGMGKTTPAQLVCNDSDVVKCFDLSIWVWVSNNFDAATVIRMILESVDKKNPTVDALETLQRILIQKLSCKEFLLVLDDVWEDGRRNEWEKLMTPLQTGQKGSNILLTTRIQSVADMDRAQLAVNQKLNGLDEDNSLVLFKRHTFAGMALEGCAEFLLTGEQIVKKMRGLSLIDKSSCWAFERQYDT